MIALDTNLLVYAHRSQVAEHRAARRAIEAAAGQGEGWGMASASLPEFWAIVTHPAASGRRSTPDQASGFVRALVAAGAEIWLPGPGFGDRLLQLAADMQVTGPRVFDLQIALMAFESGATQLWTHDKAFVKIPGLVVRDPLE